MSQPIVLITFYCQSGETEKRALSAAVGAVQGRALIRLRRLPDMGMVSDNEALLRMRKEYVPPAEKDILAADALIVVAPPDFSESSLQWKPYLEMLRRLAGAGSLANKCAATLGIDNVFFNELGVTTVGSSLDEALALGRAVADAVRAKKQQEQP
jgi:multimeric flavodoxin WrbA